jgi:DNA-binding transcriptional regulator YiaG
MHVSARRILLAVLRGTGDAILVYAKGGEGDADAEKRTSSAAWPRSCETRSVEMGKRATKKRTTVGQLMIEGAREALAHQRGALRNARVTRAKVTVRRADVVPPQTYGERDVQRVRERLGLSQAVFANLLGASVLTVRAWERGAREPSEMARRLLELAARQPEVFEETLVPSK